jgi:hypothetical protein
VASCSDDERAVLIKQGEQLGLRKAVPLVRKIVAERKAKKKAPAARDVERLKTQLTAEAKRVKTYLKALQTCNQ